MSARSILLQRYQSACRELAVLPSADVEAWLQSGPLDAPHFSASAGLLLAPRDGASPDVVVDRMVPLLQVMSFIPLREISLEGCSLAESQLEAAIDHLLLHAADSRSRETLQTLLLRGNKMNRKIFDRILELCGTHTNLVLVRVDPAPQCPMQKLDQACALNSNKQAARSLQGSLSSSPHRGLAGGKQQSFVTMPKRLAWQPAEDTGTAMMMTAAAPVACCPQQVLRLPEMIRAAMKSIDFGFGSTSNLPHALLYFTLEYFQHVAASSTSCEEVAEHIRRTESRFLDWRRQQLPADEPPTVVLHEPLQEHTKRLLRGARCVYCGGEASSDAALQLQVASPRLLLAALQSEAENKGACFVEDSPAYVIRVCRSVLTRMKRCDEADDPLSKSFLRPPDFCSEKCLRRFSRSMLSEACGLPYGVAPRGCQLQQEAPMSTSRSHVVFVEDLIPAPVDGGYSPPAAVDDQPVEVPPCPPLPLVASVASTVMSIVELRAQNGIISSSSSVDPDGLVLRQFASLRPVIGASILEVCNAVCNDGVALRSEGKMKQISCIQPPVCVSFVGSHNGGMRKPGHADAATLLRHYFRSVRDTIRGSFVVLGMKIRPSVVSAIRRSNGSDASPIFAVHDPRTPDHGGVAAAVVLTGTRTVNHVPYFVARYAGATLLVDEHSINASAEKYGAYSFADVSWQQFSALTGHSRASNLSLPVGLVDFPNYAELALLLLLRHPVFLEKSKNVTSPSVVVCPTATADDDARTVEKAYDEVMRSLRESRVDCISATVDALGISTEVLLRVVQDYRRGNMIGAALFWARMQGQQQAGGAELVKAIDRATRHLFGTNTLRLHPSLLQRLGNDFLPMPGSIAISTARVRKFAPDRGAGELLTNGFILPQQEESIKGVATVGQSYYYFSLLPEQEDRPTLVSFAKLQEAAEFTVHGRIPTVCWVQREGEPLHVTTVQVEYKFAPCAELSISSRPALLQVSYSDDGRIYTTVSTEGPIAAAPGSSGTVVMRFGNIGPHRWWRVQYLPHPSLSSKSQPAGPQGGTTAAVNGILEQQRAMTSLLSITGLYFSVVANPVCPKAASFCFESSCPGKTVFSFDGRHAILVPSTIPTHELTQKMLTAKSIHDASKDLLDLLRTPDGFFSGTGIQSGIRTVLRVGKQQLFVFTEVDGEMMVAVCDAYSGQVREPLTPVVAHHKLKKLPQPILQDLDGGVAIEGDVYLLFSSSFFALVDLTSMALVSPVTSWFRNLPGRALAELEVDGLPLGTKLLRADGSDPYLQYSFPFRSVSCIHRVEPSKSSQQQQQRDEQGVELLVISGGECLRWLAPASASTWSTLIQQQQKNKPAVRSSIEAPTFRRCDVLPTSFDGLPIAALYRDAAEQQVHGDASSPLVPILPQSMTVHQSGDASAVSLQNLSVDHVEKLADRNPQRRVVEPIIVISPGTSLISIDLRFHGRVNLAAIDVVADPCGAIWRVECVDEERKDNVVICGECRQTTAMLCRIPFQTSQKARLWRLVMTGSGGRAVSSGIYGISCLVGATTESTTSIHNVLDRTSPVDVAPEDLRLGRWMQLDAHAARLITSITVTPPMFAFSSAISNLTLVLSRDLSSSQPATAAGDTFQILELASQHGRAVVQLDEPRLCRWFAIQGLSHGGHPSSAALPAAASATFCQVFATYVPLAPSVIRNITKKPGSYVEAAAAAAATAASLSTTGGQLKREDRTYYVYLDRPHDAVCRIVGTAFTNAAPAAAGADVLAGAKFAIFTRPSGDAPWQHQVSSAVHAADGLLDCSFMPLATPIVAVRFLFDQPRVAVSVRDVIVFEAVVPSVDYVIGLQTPSVQSLKALLSSSLEENDTDTPMLTRESRAGSGNDEIVSVQIPPHLSCVEGINISGCFNGISITGTLLDNSRRVLHSSEAAAQSGSQPSQLAVRLPPTTLKALTVAGQISSLSRLSFPSATSMRTVLGAHSSKHHVRATLHFAGKSAEIIHSPFEFPARVGTSIIVEPADRLYASVLHFGQVSVGSTVSGIGFDVQVYDRGAGFFRSVASLETIAASSSCDVVTERWPQPYCLASSLRLVCTAVPPRVVDAENPPPTAVMHIALTPEPVLDSSAPFAVRSAACRVLTNGVVKSAHRKSLHRMMSTIPLPTPIVRFSGEVESADEEPGGTTSPTDATTNNGSSSFYITLDLLAAGEQSFVGLAVLASGYTRHEILVQYSDDNAKFTTVAVHRQENGWCFSSWCSQGSHRYWRISATVISVAGRRRSRRSTSVAEIEEGDDQALISLFQPVDLKGINNVVWYVAVPSGDGGALALTAQESEAVLRAQRAPLIAVPNHDMLLFHALPIGLPPAERRVSIPPTERGENPKQAAALTRAARSRVSPTLVHAAAAMEKSLNGALPNIDNVLRVLKPETATSVLHAIFGRPAEKLTLTSAKVESLSHTVSLDPSIVVQGWTAEPFLGLPSGTPVSVGIQLSEWVQAEGTSVVQRVLLVAEQSWSSLRAANRRMDDVSRLLNISALPDQILTVHRWKPDELPVDEPELFGESYPPLPSPSSSTKAELLYPVGTEHIIRDGTTAVFQRISLSTVKDLLTEADSKSGSSTMRRISDFLDRLGHGQARVCIHAAMNGSASTEAVSSIVTVDISVASVKKTLAETVRGGSNGGVAFAGPMRLQLIIDTAANNSVLEVLLYVPVTFPQFFGNQQFLLHARLAACNTEVTETEMPEIVVCGAALIDGGVSLGASILKQSLISIRSVCAALHWHIDKDAVSHVAFTARCILCPTILLACKVTPAPEAGALSCRAYSSSAISASQLGDYVDAMTLASGGHSQHWRQLFPDVDGITLQDRGAKWSATLATAANPNNGQHMRDDVFRFSGTIACNGSLLSGEVDFAAYPKAAGYVLRLRLDVESNERVELLQTGLWFSDGTIVIEVTLEGHVSVAATFRRSNAVGGDGCGGVRCSTFTPSSVEISLNSQTNVKSLLVRGAIQVEEEEEEAYVVRFVCKQGFKGGLGQSVFALESETDLAERVEIALMKQLQTRYYYQQRNKPIHLRVHKVAVAGMSRQGQGRLPALWSEVSGVCNGCLFEEHVPLAADPSGGGLAEKLLGLLANRFAVAFLNSIQY